MAHNDDLDELSDELSLICIRAELTGNDHEVAASIMNAMHLARHLLAKLMTLPQEKRRKCLMWLLQHMRGAPSAAPLQERMALPTIVDSKHACLMYIEGLVRLSSADEFNRNVTVFLRTLSEVERTRMVESERLGKTQREQRRGGNPY
jgi:hypothetical protein